jgi:hypothetical protein
MTRAIPSLLLIVAGVLPCECIGEDIDYDALSVGVRVVALDDAKQVLKDSKVRLPRRNGVLIAEVIPYGPAHQAGAQFGDLVTSVGGKTVNTPEEFAETIRALDRSRPTELLASRLVKLKSRETWKAANPKVTPRPLREVLLAGLKEKNDAIEGVIFRYHKDSTEFVNTRSEVYAYISEKNDRYGLRLHVQYVADDWLFIEKFTFKTESEVYAVAPGFFEFERDNDGGKIWEWCDLPVSDDGLAALRRLLSVSDDVVLRCEGKAYRKDRTLTEEEKQRLRVVLMAYDMLRQE